MSNEENSIEKEEPNIDRTDTAEVRSTAVEEDAAVDAEKSATDVAADTRQAEQNVDTDSPSVKESAEEVSENDVKSDAKERKIKSDKPRGATVDLAKNKIFKAVYYPVLALLVVVMMIFSIMDGVFGCSSNVYDASYLIDVKADIAELTKLSRSSMSSSTGIVSARDYIVNGLTGGGFTYVAEKRTDDDDDDATVDDVATVTEWAVVNGSKAPTVTVQTATPSVSLQDEMGVSKYLTGAVLNNVVAAIPSDKENAGAVIITVRYDSRIDTDGAAQNAAFVANAMRTLVKYASEGSKFDNDLIVVFTEELDNAFGSYVFIKSFEGLNNVVSRAKAGVNLDAYGNGGTLALTDVGEAGYDYLTRVTNVYNTFDSSVIPDTLGAELANKNAVKAFGDIPSVQIALLGGMDKAQSPLDTVDDISDAVLNQQAAFLKNYIEEFTVSNKTFTSERDDNMVIFSYLGGGTIVYTSVASYVIGALIIALIAGVITAMALKKTFSIKNMFKAAGLQLLVIASTLAATVASYFLVTLMLTGFGVLPIHAITSVRYFNAGILIAAMIVSVAAAFGFTTLYKKLFRVTSSDAVRGTAMLFGIVGAVMSFACPAYSFMTSWLGMLLTAVLLVSVCCHKIFKNKFGMGLDRLYLYAIPVAICLPLVMAEISALMWLLPLVLLPVIMMPFTGMLGVAVPYLDRTRAVFDKVAKKLPMRTIRVERVVTEKVEDRAKKGKFTEQTFKRVEKEKVAVNYKNYFGISVLTVLGIVVALFSGGFGVSFGKTLTGYTSYENAIYNDALVYEWTKDASGTETQRLVIDDLMTYKFARYSLTDLEWSDGKYVKNVNYSTSGIISNEPTINKTDDVYNVTTFDGAYSYVTIKIPSARSITKITVKEQSKTDSGYNGYVYEFNNKSEIVLRMPYGFGNFTMEIEGAKPSTFEYEEYRAVSVAGSDTALDNVDEWNRLKVDFAGTDVYDNLSGGIVIKRTFSV